MIETIALTPDQVGAFLNATRADKFDLLFLFVAPNIINAVVFRSVRYFTCSGRQHFTVRNQTVSLLNLTQAAKAAGVSRTTLYNKINSGKLSTISNDSGVRCVDTSELLRVYGSLQGDTYTSANTSTPHERNFEHDIHKIDVHNESVMILSTKLENAQRELEAYRQREERLLDLLEQQGRLLEDKRKEVSTTSEAELHEPSVKTPANEVKLPVVVEAVDDKKLDEELAAKERLIWKRINKLQKKKKIAKYKDEIAADPNFIAIDIDSIFGQLTQRLKQKKKKKGL